MKLYSWKVKWSLITCGTAGYFIAFFFSDKQLSLQVFCQHLNDPLIYLCLLISFLGSYFLEWWITSGALNGSKGAKPGDVDKFD